MELFKTGKDGEKQKRRLERAATAFLNSRNPKKRREQRRKKKRTEKKRLSKKELRIKFRLQDELEAGFRFAMDKSV